MLNSSFVCPRRHCYETEKVYGMSFVWRWGTLCVLRELDCTASCSTAECGAAGHIFQGGDVWPCPLVSHPDALAKFDTEGLPGDYPSAICFVQLSSKSRKGIWESLPEGTLQTLHNRKPVRRPRGRWHRITAVKVIIGASQ